MKNLEIIDSKISSREQIIKQCAVWRFKEKKIVFTNGCFDILHLGHIEYLAKALDCGDVLIVGMNSDASVKKIKGPDRPVNDEHARAILLAALSFVHAVVLFDEETPYELIKTIHPDVLVKGKDYAIEQIVGHDIVLATGGEIKTIELTQGYSTTSLIEKIKGITHD
jgi:D-glycero-beta-D-manno-heptose 1-phosphate adenylyltransferase